ncbi:MAG: SMC-Scp complex subunit ScpB [Bacillota bacterium]|nr:SMC-Scp complex subunit ScpB [Bacillota bacterium]
MNGTMIKSAMEAILFASGTPVPIQRFVQALELSPKEAESYLESLRADYCDEQKGLEIIRLDDSYQMVTKKEHAEVIRSVMDLKRNLPLSQAAMEVLAVIAYNQPVTKAFVEQVRGVDCSGVIGSLTVKNLIEEKGRLELPGRPLLYGTTENFLRVFSLKNINELPQLPDREDVLVEGISKEDIDENQMLLTPEFSEI